MGNAAVKIAIGEKSYSVAEACSLVQDPAEETCPRASSHRHSASKANIEFAELASPIAECVANVGLSYLSNLLQNVEQQLQAT